jgi:hypothetical protein
MQQPINKCNNKKKQHLSRPSIATSPTQKRVNTNELSAIVQINGKEQYTNQQRPEIKSLTDEQ